MPQNIKISKGLDIKLIGDAEKSIGTLHSDLYAVKPSDFVGFVPKVMVKEGDIIEAGAALMHDKKTEEIVITSPVSGEVVEVRRGDKRLLLEIVVKSDGKMKSLDFGALSDLKGVTPDKIAKKLLDSGVWAYIKRRPYGTIATAYSKPKAIYVSAFDTTPLAVDNDFIIKGNEAAFQMGINVLSALIDNKKVNLNLNGKTQTNSYFAKVDNTSITYFEGPHPAGNVGTQINKISPINKGETVWTIDIQGVIIIGRLFLTGFYDASKIIALVGGEVKKPMYYKTVQGANVELLLKNNLKIENVRVISGNVLNGYAIENNGFLGFYDNQITVIPEGDKYELLGWAMPRFRKYSFYSSYFSWICPNKKYNLDTNLNGGERAMVVTGKFEQVFPFNIYPMQLIKACIIEDIELMERLGIYEVEPEDFALCEFIDTSKTEIQRIVRDALEMMRKEME